MRQGWGGREREIESVLSYSMAHELTALTSLTFPGEESLTIFVDKRKLREAHSNSGAANGTLTLEALHHLAASYFIDRDSTLRKLHHLQIASAAIKV